MHGYINFLKTQQTPPKTDMSPEWWLENYLPFDMATFLGDMLRFRGVILSQGEGHPSTKEAMFYLLSCHGLKHRKTHNFLLHSKYL